MNTTNNPAPAWTPGPWEISPTANPSKEFGISAADGTIIARLDYWHDEAGPEMEANARLIAAAPEMADILSELLQEADSRGGGLRIVTRYNVDRARAILAKIGGAS